MILDTKKKRAVKLGGEPLTIPQIAAVANRVYDVQLTDDPAVISRIEEASSLIERAVCEGRSIYGVTTGFGGMANMPVPADLADASQNNLLSFLASAAGRPISSRHVRAAMALRANVLLQGKSGVRFEIIERLIRFLQADAIPVVRELGSIGASGDLVPLSAIARAITGQTNRVKVRWMGVSIDGQSALEKLDLEPLKLTAKEGLAIVNGTSFSSAIAANSLAEARYLMALALGTQAMMLQALQVQVDSYDAFVHQQKPHPGQVWTAEIMLRLLREGCNHKNGKPVDIQDRYSLRCFPQYMGPIVEGISRVTRVVETEMNAVSDNPLVDPETGRFYQSGNFLGQYVGVAMDDLRRYIGLMAKHLDVQIATLVAPEFSNGLTPSLRGNESRSYNMGLKGLQVTGNSIAPILAYYGNPIVEHFPTHAEQFNQNINGLSWGSANLAWKSVELFRHYISVAIIFSLQALDLRAKSSLGHYDGSKLLGSFLSPFYQAACEAMDLCRCEDEPLLFNDSDIWLEEKLCALHENMRTHGSLVKAVGPILDSFDDQQF